jgi:hypothetical protein
MPEPAGLEDSRGAPSVPLPEPALALEIFDTLWTVRAWIAGLLLSLTAMAALTPSLAWLASEAVKAVRLPDASVPVIVAALGPVAIAIGIDLALFEFSEKLFSKAVEARLILTLQRIYISRRAAKSEARDGSVVLYGAEVAKKGLEAIYKDSWRIPVQVAGIVIWQLKLDAEWLPFLLVSAVPALACVWVLGDRLQAVSRQILDLQAELLAATKHSDAARFHSYQEGIFRRTLKFEIIKWLVERGLDAGLWVFAVHFAVLAWRLRPELLPFSGDLGGAAAFAVNLALLIKPLSGIGKAYTKWREALPALRSIYERRDARPLAAGV